jgi:hypothetical protein
MQKRIHVLMLLALLSSLCVEVTGQRQIPITVTAQPVSQEMKSWGPLLLRITISNGLSQDIRFSTFALSPNEWNGEVVNISLVDIYRNDREPKNVFLARPKLGETPKYIAGIASYQIKSGESRSVVIDISKWQIHNGWTAGGYTITVRVENIQVDHYTSASVMSEPTQIEIK